MPRLAIIVVSILSLLAVMNSAVRARTWTVERDGSGDFAIIQNAVNAAASGDTIMIGPGLYDEGEVYSTPGWTEYVRVLVTVPELTLIGSGDDTIIGQEEMWDLEQGFHRGLFAGEYFGNQSIRLHGILFQNNGHAVIAEDIDVVVSSCSFEHNVSSFGASGRNIVEVRDCRFTDVERNGTHLLAFSSESLVVRDCQFVLWDHHQWNQVHLNLTGVNTAKVQNCDFLEGAAGAAMTFVDDGLISNCRFIGQSMIGANAELGSTVLIQNCEFRDQYCVTELTSSDITLTVRNCTFEDVEFCTAAVGAVDSLSFRDCDLAGGELGAVWIKDCSTSPPQHVDFTNNYWGTADPDSIRALIRDYNDTEDACRIVDFEPFREHSTPVVPMSLSDLKSLMRRVGK